MSIEQRLQKRNLELQQEVQREINKSKAGESKRNLLQLQTILRELQNGMADETMIFSYPRFIVDSWDYADELGKKLLELSEMYKRSSAKGGK